MASSARPRLLARIECSSHDWPDRAETTGQFPHAALPRDNTTEKNQQTNKSNASQPGRPASQANHRHEKYRTCPVWLSLSFVRTYPGGRLKQSVYSTAESRTILSFRFPGPLLPALRSPASRRTHDVGADTETSNKAGKAES